MRIEKQSAQSRPEKRSLETSPLPDVVAPRLIVLPRRAVNRVTTITRADRLSKDIWRVVGLYGLRSATATGDMPFGANKSLFRAAVQPLSPGGWKLTQIRLESSTVRGSLVRPHSWPPPGMFSAENKEQSSQTPNALPPSER